MLEVLSDTLIVRSGTDVYISDCEFLGEVSGTSEVGGIFGRAVQTEAGQLDEGPFNLTSCKVTGTLRASSSRLGSMGGAALIEFGDTCASIIDCEFSGKAYLQSVETTCDLIGYAEGDVTTSGGSSSGSTSSPK